MTPPRYSPNLKASATVCRAPARRFSVRIMAVRYYVFKIHLCNKQHFIYILNSKSSNIFRVIPDEIALELNRQVEQHRLCYPADHRQQKKQ